MTKPMIPERIEEKKQIAVTVSRMPEEKINDLYDKICELAHAEDGEQLEDILSEFNLMNVGYDAAWDEVERLLAALEESQQSAKNWEESYLSLHEKFREKRTELAEAQQTIARQQEAMDRASDMMNHKHPAYRLLQDALLPAEEGSDKA